jgi:phosphatidylglycerol:prolipoprotein diacylglycerol transferase
MHPILATFSIGGTEVMLRAYSTFYVLAWITAIILATVVAWRRGMPWWRALVVFVAALAVGVLGARLLDLAVNWGYYAKDTSRIYDLGFQGFSLYGGLILALVTGAVLARILGMDLWRLADATVPAVASGIILMRIGCFLNGCCFGTETSLPWGVTFPVGSPAWAQQVLSGKVGLLGFGSDRPVHPTQLYEIAAALVLGSFATWLLVRRCTPQRRPGRPARTPPGVAFLTFALSFTLFRLADDYLRAKPLTATLPEWFYPVLYALICAVTAALIAWRVRSPRSTDPTTVGGEILDESEQTQTYPSL